MHICLIMDNPETPRHPVIAVALQKLSKTHTIRMFDVRPLTGAQAIAEEEKHPLADLYLLKSHAPQALDVAHVLEQRGALVVNSWESSVACQDRVLMAQRMDEAHLPWPGTRYFSSLESLLTQHDLLSTLSFPLIIKSYYSHRGDLVDKLHNLAELQALAPQWSKEPVVLQDFAAGDGWDIKLWVIGQQIFAARRRTPLEPNAPKEDFPIAEADLPAEWARITLEIGRAFNLRLYGVDLLVMEHGPMIVDVNSFPGFRGVPGADDALVALVERLGEERQVQASSDTTLSILELPSVLTDLFARAHRPLLAGATGPLGLFVRYLRRKPGRGLAVIYAVDELRSSHKTRANDPNRAVSLTLDEQALDGAHIRFTAEQAQHASLEILPSGVLRAQDLGISVQAFPADGSLPALAASCDTTPHSPLFTALEQAAQAQLHDATWHLVAAQAIPVRYKPANRCVIRYHLQLEQGTTQKTLTLFGKVYADPEQASSVQALQQQLYTEQASTSAVPLLPRPLGIIEQLGLTINEAVQPDQEQAQDTDERWNVLRTGTRALQPHIERGRGGVITNINIPEEELRLTAQALARIHSSIVRPGEATPRTGAKEAKRARERATLIAGRNAEQAAQVQQLAQELASRLEKAQPPTYRSAHGGFKASQLLFHSRRVFVVDFDGFCLADSALDVGYFLAYLRPSALWYHKAGMRQWFESAAEIFRTTYRQAMLAHNVDQNTIDGILERSRLYEAALIFKIATRRVNRLNSPRSHELSAMLDEIALCLEAKQ